MTKLYAESSPEKKNLKPKQETINLILSYSKALKVMRLKNDAVIEVIQN